MDQGVGDRAGGIRGLCQLLSEYGEAIEYDLIALGRDIDHLGTRALSWRDLLIILKHSPADSAFKRAIRGDAADWDLGNHLLAGVFDLLATANWQRSGDGKAKRPAPLPRPGMTARAEGDDLTAGRSKPVTTEQMDRLLGWTRE